MLQYLPVALGPVFQKYLQKVLPAILDGRLIHPELSCSSWGYFLAVGKRATDSKFPFYILIIMRSFRGAEIYNENLSSRNLFQLPQERVEFYFV
jgi:hypothetical protein